MRIAIIGGGAAGMTAAHLLNKVHEISLFEKAPVLGGNIRTLNRNIACNALDKNITLDNGVIEFQHDNFPNFYKLMHDLQVQLAEVSISSELFLADDHYYKSAGAIRYGCKTKQEQIITSLKQMPVMFSYLYFLTKISIAKQGSFRHRPVSDYLGKSINARWQKMLLMYAYSMPYNMIDNFPAEMAIPLLSQSGLFTTWDRIVGGVYTYIEKSYHVCRARFTAILISKVSLGQQQVYKYNFLMVSIYILIKLFSPPHQNKYWPYCKTHQKTKSDDLKHGKRM